MEPIEETLQADYTADEDTLAYLELLQQTFFELSASPAEDFKIAEVDGGVAVTDYLGDAKAVRIPDTLNGKAVVAITDAAFADCKQLETLYIPDGVQTYGIGVLKGCTALQKLRAPMPSKEETAFLGFLFGGDTPLDNAMDVPASLVYFEMGGSNQTLAPYAFFDCNDLQFIALPKTLTEVEKYAFYNCSRLIHLDVSSLSSLGEHALDSCSSLTRLDFSQSLTSLGFAALQNCDGLRTLTLPFVGDGGEHSDLGYVFGASVPDFAKGYYPPYLVQIDLLPTCKELGNYAFYECLSLTRITIPEGLSSVGVRAFAGCERLEELSLPASLKSVRENAFFGCLSLKSVSFADGSVLESIGINAFYQCGQLKEICLPASLKALPASCFADCFSLERVDLGGVSSVGKNAFHRCTRLASATVAEAVEIEDGNEPLARVLAPTV